MPECGNCGGYISRRYERVFKPENIEQVRCCPKCEDKIRRGPGEVDDTKNPRI